MAATSPGRRRPSGVMTAIAVCPATAWATVATRPSPTTTPTARLSASPQPLASTATVDAAGSCATVAGPAVPSRGEPAGGEPAGHQRRDAAPHGTTGSRRLSERALSAAVSRSRCTRAPSARSGWHGRPSTTASTQVRAIASLLRKMSR